jgi:hypothetical protein
MLSCRCRYNPNTKSNDAIRRKVDEYLSRSEEIKGFITKKKDAAKKPPPKAAAEAAGSGAGESDAELREALMSLVVVEPPGVTWVRLLSFLKFFLNSTFSKIAIYLLTWGLPANLVRCGNERLHQHIGTDTL